MNEAERLRSGRPSGSRAMADAYQKKSGTTVELNAVDHNTFQE